MLYFKCINDIDPGNIVFSKSFTIVKNQTDMFSDYNSVIKYKQTSNKNDTSAEEIIGWYHQPRFNVKNYTPMPPRLLLDSTKSAIRQFIEELKIEDYTYILYIYPAKSDNLPYIADLKPYKILHRQLIDIKVELPIPYEAQKGINAIIGTKVIHLSGFTYMYSSIYKNKIIFIDSLIYNDKYPLKDYLENGNIIIYSDEIAYLDRSFIPGKHVLGLIEDEYKGEKLITEYNTGYGNVQCLPRFYLRTNRNFDIVVAILADMINKISRVKRANN